MKHEGYSCANNWNYVALSLIIVISLSLAILYSPDVKEFDVNLLETIRAFFVQYPLSIPNTIADFGRANYLLWPQIAACSALVSHKKYFKAFLLVFMMQTAKLVTGFMKEFICRERPSAYDGYSFPSEHVLATMCFYGILIYLVHYYVANKFWRYFLITVFGLFIILVSLSKLWLNIHYPIDVTAGLLIGLALVNLYIIICKIMNN